MCNPYPIEEEEKEMENEQSEIRIYVACLAAYNNGKGRFIPWL